LRAAPLCASGKIARVSDSVALLAILARVRRRSRTLAALEGMVVAAAAVVATTAIVVALLRWRAVPVSLHRLRWEVAAALAIVALGTLAGALRRIPLDRCARFIDRALDGGGARASDDRVLSALTFARIGDGGDARHNAATPFMRAAIADAVAHAQHVAPGAAAPLRRPRAMPAFAVAAILLGVGALSPMPARGSRAPSTSLTSTTAASKDTAARVRLPGRALDPERDEVAAALRAANQLRDPELATLARALATTVTDLSNRGLDPAEAFDRLSELLHRADEATADLAQLPRALDQAGSELQGSAATRDSGRALSAEDGAATERALNDLAARAADATAGDRNRIAASLDRAGERVGAIDDGRAASSQPSSPPAPGTAPSSSGSAGMSAGADPQNGEAESQEPGHRRLARDQPQSPATQSGPAGAPRAPNERHLQRLQRELKQTASACRTDPEACRKKLERQAHELPRMEDEARSLSPRQRLAEAVRQLRERLRREGGGAGERAREERRFLRSARGENGHSHGTKPNDGEAREGEHVVAEDPDGVGEGDDMESEGGESDGAGDSAPFSADSDRSEGAPGDGNPGQGSPGQDSANGDGIGTQRGNDPLGERGAMITRGRAREAQVKDGAGPTRSQVIQSAAQRGFAHTGYQNVFTDYQAVVEESLDGSAVPPGRRYIVRRYFQLIRPQSARAPQSPAPKR